MNWRPVLAVPATCAAAAILLTGCANGATPAGSVAAASASASAPAPASASAGASRKAPGSGLGSSQIGDPGDPKAPACATATLKITIDAAQGGTGHSVAPVHFRNTGARCWIQGYPAVTATTAAGGQVTVAQTPRGWAGGLVKADEEISPFLLEPGDTASALIEALNANPDGTACRPVTGLQVTPPKQHDPVKLTWDGGCAKLEVHPIIRGTTGRES